VVISAAAAANGHDITRRAMRSVISRMPSPVTSAAQRSTIRLGPNN
jgi:hypothetical protein